MEIRHPEQVPRRRYRTSAVRCKRTRSRVSASEVRASVPKAQGWFDELLARESRLVQTGDDRWTRGRKIVRYGGYSVSKDDQEAALLKDLYESA